MGVDRQRTVPPDFFLDEQWMQMPDDLFRMAIGLYFHVDDHGRQTTTEWNIRQSVFPSRSDLDDDRIVEMLLELADMGVIGIYTSDQRSYLCLCVWPSQSHPKPSRFPEPPEGLRRSAGDPMEIFSAGEREGVSESGSAEESPAGLPPSPFCPIHRPAGTDRDCRHCGTARLYHEQWLREHRASGGTSDG